MQENCTFFQEKALLRAFFAKNSRNSVEYRRPPVGPHIYRRTGPTALIRKYVPAGCTFGTVRASPQETYGPHARVLKGNYEVIHLAYTRAWCIHIREEHDMLDLVWKINIKQDLGWVAYLVQMLHLISLNKYVVRLIINQGNSCLTYFMIVSLFLAVVLQELACNLKLITHSNRIIPLLEKILLLVRYCGENSMKKFVVSSIIRAISKSYHMCYRPNSFSLFVLFHLV